jgi:UDP-N-acetyl-D-glucosamine dehydrogenase
VAYHDPYVPRLHDFDLDSVQLNRKKLAAQDAVVIVTAHSSIDYREVVAHAPLLVDLRNATAGIPGSGTVWKL